MLNTVPDFDTAFARPDQILFGLSLLKSATTEDGEDPNKPWTFHGIASDETQDVEGDRILRKSLDVSYASKRGYVNWDHGRGPEDQIGFLTTCEVLIPQRIEALSKSLGYEIPETATCYVAGELYKHVERAEKTHKMLKSVPPGAVGPGLSLDGAIARSRESRGVIKAFVRGVAITPAPAHPNTMARLAKSIQAYHEFDGLEFPANLPKEIAAQVVEELQKNASQGRKQGMSHDEAVIYLLQKRPHWTYELASKLVKYTIQKLGRGA